MKKVKKEYYDNLIIKQRELKTTVGFQSKQLDFVKNMVLDSNNISKEVLYNTLDRIELEHRRTIK